MDSHITAVAFDHLAVFPKRRDAIRTCHGTAVAADTVGSIVNCKIGIWIFSQAGTWAGADAGSIGTMHTSQRQVAVFYIPFFFHFQIKYISERSLSIFYLKIVLIHAGNGAGSAGNTFGNIQIYCVLFQLCTFFLIPHLVEL